MGKSNLTFSVAVLVLFKITISILQIWNVAFILQSRHMTFIFCFRTQNPGSIPLSDTWWPGLGVSQARQLLQLLSKIFVKKTFPPRLHDEWWKCCKLTQSFPSGDVPSRVSAVYGQLLGWSSSALTKLKHLFYSSAANALMFLWKKFTKSSNYGNMQSPDDSGRQ